MAGPVQLALVGLGRMESVHARALSALDAIAVVAVADPSADAGRVRLGSANGMVDLEGVSVADVTAVGVANQAVAFAAAIRGTGPAGPGALASARATVIGHAVQNSIRTGAAIDIEPIGFA